MANVLIILASFNGEEYLSQQLDSILNQNYTNWHLIIQDDGSDDNTVSIANDYAKKDSRIEVRKNESVQHGAFINFHSLINYCKDIVPFDYYCFCDQDDIWLPNKLNVMMSMMSKLSQPQLCYADMDLIDGSNRCIGASLSDNLGLKYKNKLSTFFSHNVFGCNVMVNRLLFFAVPKVDLNNIYTKILSHDNLYAKFAATVGSISYSSQITMHYRRHEKNVTSKQKYSFDLTRIINRFLHINELARDHARTYNQTLLTLELLKRNTELDAAFLASIEYVIRQGGLTAIHFIVKNKISWGKRIKTFSHCIILFSGLYKKYLIS